MLKNRGINVRCKTQLNNLTYNGFTRIKEWCAKNGIYYYYSCGLRDRYDGSSVKEFELDSDISKKIYSEIIQDGKISKEFGEKKYFECGAGKYGLMISSDFKIRPCSEFYSIENAIFSSLGNLDDAIKKMVSYIYNYKGKVLKKCKGCESYSVCKECILTDLHNYEYRCDFYKSCFKDDFF